MDVDKICSFCKCNMGTFVKCPCVTYSDDLLIQRDYKLTEPSDPVKIQIDTCVLQDLSKTLLNDKFKEWPKQRRNELTDKQLVSETMSLEDVRDAANYLITLSNELPKQLRQYEHDCYQKANFENRKRKLTKIKKKLETMNFYDHIMFENVKIGCSKIIWVNSQYIHKEFNCNGYVQTFNQTLKKCTKCHLIFDKKGNRASNLEQCLTCHKILKNTHFPKCWICHMKA